MRIRAMTATGDMQFGGSVSNFYINSAAGVAQLIETRLKLWAGEWFLDLSEGTPWMSQILGTGTMRLYNAAIRARILGTTGVLSIVSYSSSVNATTRALTVNGEVETIYSENALINTNLSLSVPQ